MERVAAGDRQAFAVLMDRHLPAVVRLAGRIVWTAEDAYDLAQEIFLRVWTRAELFDPSRAAFATWLYRLVVNGAIDRRRRTRPDAPLDLAAEVPDLGASAEDALDERQQRLWLERQMKGLPEKQRTALALFYFDDLGGKRAAEILQMSRGAFDVLLHRARKALRRRVEEGEEQR
jgi:RNA polymerase sigma-70 factor (ECF subfamily)